MKSLIITLVFMTQNPDFDRADVPQMVEMLKAKYSEQLGVPLRFRIRHLNTSKCSEWANDVGSSARANRWYCLAGIARKRFSRQGLVHFLVPPVVQNGTKWMTGVSSMKCAGSVSYSVIERTNSKGEDRYLHSLSAMVHEVGHGLGADHIDSPTVMNSGVLGLVKDRLLDFDKKSIQEIRNKCF
jgi:hypothetical protein